MNNKKYKVKLTVSFDYDVDIEAINKEMAHDLAQDHAMDYLDITLSDSRKFNEFWEYKVKCKADSITEIENEE